MKGLRKILRVSWTAKKTSEWVLNRAGVKRELLDTVKARKLAYYGHTMRKQGSCLEKEIMQGTMPGARRRGRPRTAWMGNIKTWTGLPVEESIRMTEDRDKWRNSSFLDYLRHCDDCLIKKCHAYLTDLFCLYFVYL